MKIYQTEKVIWGYVSSQFENELGIKPSYHIQSFRIGFWGNKIPTFDYYKIWTVVRENGIVVSQGYQNYEFLPELKKMSWQKSNTSLQIS